MSDWFNKTIAFLIPLMPKSFVWLFSKRYIAGKTLQEAIKVSRQLNSEGMKVTIDILGEFITTLEEAEVNKMEYLDVIDMVEKNNIDSNYSLKPSMFGLLLDEEVCYRHILEIVSRAAATDNFVRIDMEDSGCTDKEIKLFRKLKKEYPKHVGLVLQAYLKRTLDDIKSLEDLHSAENPVNYRLCKGIYVEHAEIAFKKYEEINRHYLEDLDYIFSKGMYPGIATHDKKLVEEAFDLIDRYQLSTNSFEFQMLYGVTPELRKTIVDKGYSMRVYVPFGQKWFAYSTRRLKENPNMTGLILKALFIRG